MAKFSLPLSFCLFVSLEQHTHTHTHTHTQSELFEKKFHCTSHLSTPTIWQDAWFVLGAHWLLMEWMDDSVNDVWAFPGPIASSGSQFRGTTYLKVDSESHGGNDQWRDVCLGTKAAFLCKLSGSCLSDVISGSIK